MSSFLEINWGLYLFNKNTDKKKKKVTFGNTESIENSLINSESNINSEESDFNNVESNTIDSEVESNRLILVIFGFILVIIILLILYNFNLLKN